MIPENGSVFSEKAIQDKPGGSGFSLLLQPQTGGGRKAAPGASLHNSHPRLALVFIALSDGEPVPTSPDNALGIGSIPC
jgi:hypothetical protein